MVYVEQDDLETLDIRGLCFRLTNRSFWSFAGIASVCTDAPGQIAPEV